MFKSWRGEKKIKALFEMQFQATQVPQLKAKTLMVSLVPADVGKPTVRLQKASIIDGNCIWENPIYETVKLVRESKTGRFREKVYYLVVSTGSSRKGFLGETYVDFSDLVEAPGPLMLSLPLQPSDSGTILHVTVYRIQPTPDPSNSLHEYPADDSNGGSLDTAIEDYPGDGSRSHSSTEDRKCSEMLLHYAQNNIRDKDPPLDNESITQCMSSLSPTHMPQKVGSDSENHDTYRHSRSFTDWSSGSASDGMMQPTNGLEDNFKKESIHETSQNTVERFKNQIKMLERQAELSELEIQSLRKQLVKESRREQELSKQICSLQDERDSFKTKYEQLKSSINFMDDEIASNDKQAGTEDLRAQLEEVKEKIQHEQHLNKKLRMRLQKAEDSNSELIIANRDLNGKLNQKSKEVSQISRRLNEEQEATLAVGRELESKSDYYEDINAPGRPFEGRSNADEAEELRQKINDLCSEIKELGKEKEDLITREESISQKCESLEKENADLHSDLEKNKIEFINIQREYSESLATARQFRLDTERLEREIKRKASKYLGSLETINELETKIKRLEEELQQKTQDFQESLEIVTEEKIKQENRARLAEEALRKSKSDTAHAVDRLQEELMKVTVEMSSKIDENEKTAMDAASEAHDLRLKNQVLEGLLEKTKSELTLVKEQYERKLNEISQPNNLELEQTENASVECIKKNTRVKDFDRYLGSEIPWSNEKAELERELARLRTEVKILLQQSETMKILLDESRNKEKSLHSEMQKLRVQYDELQHQSFELKTENEELQMQVTSMLTNQPNDNKASTTNVKSHKAGQGINERMNPVKISITDGIPVQNEYGGSPIRCDKRVAKNKEQVGNNPSLSKALSEITALKERNEHMEGELKEMQERYSDISLKFAEVEGERQQLVMTLRNLKNGKKL